MSSESPSEFKHKYNSTHNIKNVKRSGAGLRVVVSCKECGDIESVTASRVRAGKKKFCSSSCSQLYIENESVDLSNSNATSYIGGVYVGDGSIGRYNGENVFRLNTIDKKFRDEAEAALSELGFNTYSSSYHPESDNESEIFFVRIRSMRIVKYLENNFSKCDPEVIKSGLHSKVDKSYFIKGFYESEGSACEDRYDIRMSQKNKGPLVAVSDLLDDLGFDSNIYAYTNTNEEPIHILQIIGGRDERLRFFEEFNPVIRNEKDEIITKI